MAATDSAYEQATRLLSQRNLHQKIWLPQTSTHARLRVTFSTTTNFVEDESLPVVLFIGPMFGTRYMGLMFDRMAREIGVRMICVDRPGLGGSMPVKGDQRVDVWLETVPVLLQHLNVKHVHIMSHSAGTIYTLNTISRFRDMLHPKSPYVALLAPWVDNKCSNVGLMNAASKLPAGAFSYWSNLNEFISQRVMPASLWSGGLFSSMAGRFQAQPGEADTGDSEDAQEKYGVDKKTTGEIEALSGRYAFAEDMSGGNDEARLCVKKLGAGAWADCEDYMDFVGALSRREKERMGEDGAASRLKVRMHFAESDVLIGKGGQRYFEECWKQDGVAESIDVVSKEWPGSNHDSVLVDSKVGAVRSVLEEIKRLR
ncbi:Hypothetical predicted protein [Lecanosticta acicola]|uniref:AB hydrolase-1 domain-containing protein n=1 Tax=Lecanosticta acicola TaxID=111012 RepID=A0AAI8YUG5_9PEZI|nr:Hypothetical predicted protein [Lecanosticta acicola]